jgi:hypothetical protein
MIRDWLDSTNQGNALPQRRGKLHPHIALWNKTFLIEIVSTIFVHVRILMDEWGHDIDMFRLGSLPLEQTFGTLCQRSRDNHTFDHAMEQTPAMQFLRFYRADHWRIARRLKFDHVMCLANSAVPSRLHGVNPVRWARDALQFLI